MLCAAMTCTWHAAKCVCVTAVLACTALDAVDVVRDDASQDFFDIQAMMM